VRGTDRAVAFAEVADAAYHGAVLPPGCSPGLEVAEFYDPPDTNDPQAIHLAVVAVDAETGAVRLRALYAADDCGVVINPMIVEGQVHGGIAQGIGQALLESAIYDQSGQLLTASYMDYCMPRADDLPSFSVGMTRTRCPSNPLGIKGCGEAGAIAAPPAVINALTDALGHENLAMPATPQTVWRAAQKVQSKPLPNNSASGGFAAPAPVSALDTISSE
jgi:carbon-monoxide dehydrogenase large subunit